ncbi:MAG: AraC family transcriptional regulator [Verrucomicrobia bacterium]|nr:AraC family transcriptional regulator [Verrucomicrobiota bacterium]MBT7066687.1 AraC family transcriptional regulator [Verrucomicrobiota bacterium]MBT7702209.1 AraC family transcriptional regulator [Verrucomicrobiota bacterium]
MLEHTDLLVEEIAFDVGFSDPFHFSRVFRTIIGLSPRAWRKRQG